jgi:beta-lactamase regulating signal transducer with metallopeptidase domain
MSFPETTSLLAVLGWSLLNSLWQAAILYSLYQLVTGIFNKANASARHALALCFLAGAALWFLIGLFRGFSAYPSAKEITFTPFIIENTFLYNAYRAATSFAERAMPWFGTAYIACIVFRFVKFGVLMRNTSRVRNTGTVKMPVDWRLYIKNIAAQLGIQKEITALLSYRADTPQVLGFLKPVILLPVACLNHLTTVQTEAILLHELVHIKRNDYFVNLFIATAEILFFFNPFIRQLISSIRREREYRCDDMVLQFRYPPEHYAAALLSLEKNRALPTGLGIAAGGSGKRQLLARIQRIVGINKAKGSLLSSGACLSAFLLLGFIALINPVKTAITKATTVTPATIATLASVPVKGIEPGYHSGMINTVSISTPAPEGKKSGISACNKNGALHNCPVLTAQPVAFLPETMEDENLQTALHTTAMDFSLPVGDAMNMPAAPNVSSLALPYVPNSSFFYYFVPDTSQPAIKGETYAECMAKEALIKTRKALEQINWNKIEQQLNYNKEQVDRLKQELAIELAKLNWQKINDEVQQQLKASQYNNLQKLMQQQLQMEQFQKTAAYYELVQKQLQDNQQYLKDTQQQQLQYRKATEEKNRQILDSSKRKKIVYI